uniref:LRAT domain-containing protein n=1 Tax=Rhabditophanes sp. KR3021 TaxID=114890 RepID=A0AC35U414_9BILA
MVFLGLEGGDIIIYSRTYKKDKNSSDFGDSIACSSSTSGVKKDNDYHCALVTKCGYLIETTTNENGVHEVGYDEGICAKDVVIISYFHVELPVEKKRKAVEWARAQIGIKYNYCFDPLSCFNDKVVQLYCSQLIAEAYKHAYEGEEPPFPESIMAFNSSTVGFWEKYYGDYNRPIPVNTLGTHPNDFRKSEHVKFIGKEESNGDMLCITDDGKEI